uniref:hypothetical protein n=1 Tax=Pararhizobium sp. IMCC3301 TaxID=3067904 RepID=UPI002742434D|nr:hypothetical protein [Pararhizobium sp. IMCC3301]
MKRNHLLNSTALIVILSAGVSSVYAADLTYLEVSSPEAAYGDKPAVSAINAKVAAAFGVLDDDFLSVLSGSVTAPIGHRYGVQLDAMGALRDGDEVSGGVGGHLFWRNPDFGLVGLYGSYTHVEWGAYEDIGNAAVEAEYYFDNVTISGLIGAEFGDSDGVLAGSTLSFYPIDDLRLYAGYRYQLDKSYGVAGFEILPEFAGLSNLAFYADGIVDEDGDYGVFGGVRLYLGSDKPLKARHREDDPIESAIPPNLLQSIEPSKNTVKPEIG